MLILFIEQFTGSQFIKALSWTFIHSLWLGLIAAIITGIIIINTKKASALLRYNLFSGVFICFLIATIATFLIQFNSSASSEVITGNTAVINNFSLNDPLPASVIENNTSQNFYTIFKNYFNANAPLVVLIWFLFFVVQSVKLFAGLHYINRIRHQKTTVPETEWKTRLQSMCVSLGIHQQVLFLQSEIVKMPVVIGFLKPTVIVPLGLLSNLPVEQVETILLHELAHIRRKDYLVNMLQCVAEAVLFFNPAVLWMSSLLREEREACCDDIVVANTANKGNYLEALVTFHEHTLKNNSYALALGGKKSFLFNRVKRMITYENKKLNIMEKLALLSGVVIFSAFTFLTAQEKNTITQTPITKKDALVTKPVVSVKPAVHLIKEEVPIIIDKVEKAVADIIIDTVPVKKILKLKSVSSNINNDGTTSTTDITVKSDDGKTYRLKKVNNNVTEFYVDGSRISESEMAAYQPIITEINDMQVKSREDAKRRAEELKIRRAEIAERNKENKIKIEENRKKALATRVEHDKRRREADKERKLISETRAKEIKNKNRLFDSKNKKLIEQNKAVRAKSLSNTQRAIELNKAKRSSVTSVRNSSDASPFLIINDLVKNDVISNTEKVSFTLDNRKLIVNGKKQSSDLHEKMKEKYIKKEGDSIDYTKDGNSTRSTIIQN